MIGMRRFLASTTILFAFAAVASARADVCDGISLASDSALTTIRVAQGLTRPSLVTAAPGDVARVFVLEQDGRIRIIENGVLLPTAFLDIASIVRSPADGAGNEEGLLGLAFHPDYANNGWFFVYHTDNTTGNVGNNLVARYQRSAADPDLANPTSRQVVINFSHPTFSNHNGGMIGFGPSDGYLYIGTGDGGDSCDPSGNAQNPLSMLGKLHRIDVGALPYSIPPGNPFAGNPSYRPEIWATGLRNPWRWSFDRATGDLYIGDVGQNQYEEIDYAPAASTGGENYGWDLSEGDHCPNPSCDPPGPCTLPGYAKPIVEYSQAGTPCSVTGGYVYRGCRMPGLHGTYFYADYCAAFIRTFRVAGGVPTDLRDRTAELAPGGGLSIASITSFGEDARGETYVVDRGGEVFKIVPVLSNLEVSGVGAASFVLGPAGWSWEDLASTSSHPITGYKVYRQLDGVGDFVCVHQAATTSWPSGDPSVPAPGSLLSYLVTAVNAGGTESSPGTGSGGRARLLSTALCPP